MLETFIQVVLFSSGRRIQVYQRMRLLVEQRAQQPIAVRIDRALAHDIATRELENRWGGRSPRQPYTSDVTNIDNIVDALLTSIRDIARAQAHGRLPDSPIAILAERVQATLFPHGVMAITSLPYVDQVIATEIIMRTLQTELASAAADLGLTHKVEQLAEATLKYRSFLFHPSRCVRIAAGQMHPNRGWVDASESQLGRCIRIAAGQMHPNRSWADASESQLGRCIRIAAGQMRQVGHAAASQVRKSASAVPADYPGYDLAPRSRVGFCSSVLHPVALLPYHPDPGGGMMGRRNRSILMRQWDIAVALSQRRRGITISQLIEATASSRATIYRDIKTMVADVGIPIISERINGEMRYRLTSDAYPPLAPTQLQVAAMHVARHMLIPLEGTRLVAEFDELLRRLCGPRGEPADAPELLGRQAASVRPELVQVIDAAIHRGSRLELIYRSVTDSEPRPRLVDPIALRMHASHLYLVAFDVERTGWRTFKIARIASITDTGERADPHPEYDEQALFAYSANVWTGAPVHVAIRLSPAVARFVTEWPLSANQTIEEQGDGSIVLHADVAGTVEAMRWVLRWGREAEALAPDELRRAVRDELAGALPRYQ